ncbi:MAG: ribosome recycling factor [Cytophagales bacterium]|nr:MAG: ribosome recycling factor [Cytophagales bacterium]
MEEIEFYLDDTKESMDKGIRHLSIELAKIRAGRATPQMLDGLFVEYYGTPTALSQISSISTPDARTLAIKPFEKGLLNVIEKAIRNSDLGLNPQNNGEIVILSVPALTEERRKDLCKRVRGEGEEAKIAIRNIRKNTNEELKKLQKDGAAEDLIKSAEEKVQKLTDSFIMSVDQNCDKKEKEIMTV